MARAVAAPRRELPPFCRYPEDGKAYEHTLFGNTYQMWEVAEERQINEGLPGRGFAFSETPDPGGKPALDIFIASYNERQSTRWQYNPEDGRYYRWNTNLPHVDAVTGKQLAADNIVVLAAEHIDRPDILDSETSGVVIETVLWGNGPAYVFRDGLWYEGSWWHTQGRTGLWLTYPGGERAVDPPRRGRRGSRWSARSCGASKCRKRKRTWSPPPRRSTPRKRSRSR